MRFFSDFPRLQCNYTTTASSFDDNKFNSPTLSHQLFCLDAARIASSRFFKIDQNAETQAKTENEKKISSRSLLCVLNFPQLQHLMRHTRETRLVSSIFVRCCGSHQRKRRSRRNEQKKSRKVSVDDGVRTLAHSQSLPFARHFNVSDSIHGQISSTFQPLNTCTIPHLPP